MKRNWFKAFEIIQDFLVNHKRDNKSKLKDPLSSKEEEIYRFQLILNYLNKEGRHGKLMFIHNELNLTSDFKETVTQTLRNALMTKRVKTVHDHVYIEDRETAFAKDQLKLLDDMISGEEAWRRFKLRHADENFDELLTKKPEYPQQQKIPNARKDRLLGVTQTQQSVMESGTGAKSGSAANVNPEPVDAEARDAALRAKFAPPPSSNEDFRKLLMDWVGQFHKNFLLQIEEIAEV